jgi:hypothetical protein
VARQNRDLLSNQADELCIHFDLFIFKTGLLLRLLGLLFVIALRSCRTRRDLLLESLALKVGSMVLIMNA